MLSLRYQPAPDWPPLAWIARLPARGESPAGKECEVLVTHGSLVETRPDWFGELVWAGDFGQADFDQTDLVFGSGGRLRQGNGGPELVFVSAGTMLDRLQSIEAGGYLWVSNSLACLLAHAGADLDPTDGTWFERMGSAIRGFDDYERSVPTSAGPARLTYFRNLVYRNGDLAELDKPHSTGGFARFEDYRDYLLASIAAIAGNAADARREFAFPILGTLSGGYDSPMMSALAARAAGLSEAFNFRRPDGSDTGEEAARVLGIRLRALGREDWRSSTEMPEIPFIAADAKGEDVFMHSASDLVMGRTVLTGHFAGVMLDRNRGHVDAKLSRRDRSGMALMEWRLIAGCMHVPVAYMGARHAADVARISKSDEMKPWSVGSWYDRPIARRILEEAGVPRDAFGLKKRAASILFFKSGGGMTPDSARDYHAWLREHAGAFIRKGKVPPTLLRPTVGAVNWLKRVAGSTLLGARRLMPAGRGGSLGRLGERLVERGGRDPLFDYVFPWAVDRLKRRYTRVPSAEAASAERRSAA